MLIFDLHVIRQSRSAEESTGTSKGKMKNLHNSSAWFPASGTRNNSGVKEAKRNQEQIRHKQDLR